MTYLEIVNGVLRRLREDQVGSVSQNPYSLLIGDLVNDTKRISEDAWDWSALRTTLTIATTADIFNYVLTGSGNRIKIIDVINDTSNNFNGVDVNGDTQIDLYPIPNAAYTIRVNCIQRNPDLVNDGDKLQIPHMPVLHLALALASRERGETGGRSAGEMLAFAQNYLSDAIALDAYKHPEETIYRAV